MNIETFCKFDIRLSYLTEKDKETWNNLNHFARTLWFNTSICGPDIEYSRFAVDIFCLYPHYESWTYCPRENGGYWLTDNSKIINADLMNGWWMLFRTLAGKKLEDLLDTKEKGLVESGICKLKNILLKKLLKEFGGIPENELVPKLVKDFERTPEVWNKFLDYLDVVYTIGNIAPTGCNDSDSYYDLWPQKLYKIKNWFDNKQEYLPPVECIEKLLGSYYSDKNWNEFVEHHFYEEYIESDSLKFVDPETDHFEFHDKHENDDYVIKFLEDLKDCIYNRGKSICGEILNKNPNLSYASVPNYTITT